MGSILNEPSITCQILLNFNNGVKFCIDHNHEYFKMSSCYDVKWSACLHSTPTIWVWILINTLQFWRLASSSYLNMLIWYEVKWSACLPSTPTIWVWILKKSPIINKKVAHFEKNLLKFFKAQFFGPQKDNKFCFWRFKLISIRFRTVWEIQNS